jgi:hypothetical protein
MLNRYDIQYHINSDKQNESTITVYAHTVKKAFEFAAKRIISTKRVRTINFERYTAYDKNNNIISEAPSNRSIRYTVGGKQ